MHKSKNNNKTSNSYVDFQHKTEEAKIDAKTKRTNQKLKSERAEEKPVSNIEIPASSNQALSEEEILNGYRNGTIIPENNGKYWTDEDRDKLASMFNNEVGITRMALDFKRKELAVMQQLVVMGLLNTPAYHRGQKQKDCGCLCSKCLNFECENNPNRPNR